MELHLPPQKNTMEQIRQVGPVYLLCALTHGIFQGGASPGTTEEPDLASLRDPVTESRVTATSSSGERTEDTQITNPPPGDGTGGPMDEKHGTSPFKYNPNLASSEITVASYKTARESIHDTTMTTLSSGHAGIGGPIDSFTYDSDLATSGTSIGSYKTERTVISTKSRYNIPARHKYADHVHLRVPAHGKAGGAQEGESFNVEALDRS